jgi:type II restriction/modification system DNA methylase subunit YeeA
MYKVVSSSQGYAIFFIEGKRKEYISDNLSLKQATKWCDRLNDAYNKGYASNW